MVYECIKYNTTQHNIDIALMPFILQNNKEHTWQY